MFMLNNTAAGTESWSTAGQLEHEASFSLFFSDHQRISIKTTKRGLRPRHPEARPPLGVVLMNFLLFSVKHFTQWKNRWTSRFGECLEHKRNMCNLLAVSDRFRVLVEVQKSPQCLSAGGSGISPSRLRRRCVRAAFFDSRTVSAILRK